MTAPSTGQDGRYIRRRQYCVKRNIIKSFAQAVQTCAKQKKPFHRHPEARGCAAAEPRRATAGAGPLILRGSAFGRAPQDDGLSFVVMNSGPATDLGFTRRSTKNVQ